jgi:hypothetical protein
MSKVAPWVALSIVGVAFAIAQISISFIESGMKVVVTNPLQITVGTDHKPAPTIHYHVTQEKRGFGT